MTSGPISRVAVVGGGITGLTAAHRLYELASSARHPIHVILHEATQRLGGVVSTVRRDGLLIEEGPDSILAEKPWAHELAARVGLSGHVIRTNPAQRRSFIVRRRRLVPTPEGLYLFAPTRFLPLAAGGLLSPWGVLRAGLDLAIPRRESDQDESVASFVTRRLGGEVLNRLAQPMVAGIYGADPADLSMRATLPRLVQLETDHGSLIKGMRASRRRDTQPASGARYSLFFSFGSGVEMLTRALASRLPGGAARPNARVMRLARSGSGWRVTTRDSQEEFDAVILAVPAPAAADLLASIEPDLAGQLGGIACGSSVTVSLAFREEDLVHRMDGFGFVVPAVEKLSILGCTFCHRKYPGRAPAGAALLRAFWGDEGCVLSDQELVRRTLADLRVLLGLRKEPYLTHIVRWPGSMPRYAVGHLDRVHRIETLVSSLPGLALAGSAYRGVGIPDCVRSGEAAAEQVMRRIAPEVSALPARREISDPLRSA